MGRVALVLFLVHLTISSALAQYGPDRAGIHGQTTTQSGAVTLPGVTVVVQAEADGREVALMVTEADGRYRTALAPGVYRIRATLSGFAPVVRVGVRVNGGDDLVIDLDIPLAMTTEVTAEALADDAPVTGTSQSRLDGRLFDVAPVKGDDFQALLPTLPGVLRGPDGRINMKGGRPTQTGLQMGQAYARDPSTGDGGLTLPVDAIASIDVLPNPYAAEYGRFSSGVAQVETRRGGDVWKTTVNNFIPVPCLTLCDGGNWGVRNYDPRIIVSGPLVSKRLFLAQSLQYHDKKDRVPSLPRGHADTGLRSLEAFTRLDLRAGRHATTATVAFFPQNLSYVGLDTFHAQPVSPDVRRRGFNVGVFDTWRFSPGMWLETTVSRTRYDTAVSSRGPTTMVITPDGVGGGFFNDSSRRSNGTQWSEVLSVVRRVGGDHAIRLGLDVLRSAFSGTSASGTVEIRRENGTLSQRLEFGPETQQALDARDVAFFAQDRWRITDRLIFEVGARADRDGVSRSWQASPRAGFVLGVLPKGIGILRGGVGRFVERTPLLAGAFASIEAPTVRRYATDGVTPVGVASTFSNAIEGALRPAIARIWNVEYDHRFLRGLLFKVNHLERDGRRELVVNPNDAGSASTLALASDGRSRYRETEATLRYSGRDEREVTLTYVRSHSAADLNAFDVYFGLLRQPIIRANEYGVTSVDVPNRLVMLAVIPIRDWLVSPLVEVRDGFPYSLLDRNQDFVGARNTGGRFDRFASLDLTVMKTITVAGRRARVGFRSNHLLDNFTPRDVQNNVASGQFGQFFNPLVRRIGLTFELQP